MELLVFSSSSSFAPNPSINLPPPKKMKNNISLRLLFVFLLLPSLLGAQGNLRESYTLRAGDVVTLSVYEEKDCDAVVKLPKLSQASFPLIGSIRIQGLTLAEASKAIETRYATDYIRNPKVRLDLTEYATETVSVIGQVKTVGPVPIPQAGTLEVGPALASAGGITDSADPNNIVLVRAEGKTEVLTLKAIQGKAGSIVMKSGDKLVVYESPHVRSEVSVLGEVNKPGSFKLPKNGKMDLASALASAGGVGEFANLEAIKFIRADGAQRNYSFQEIQNGEAGRISVGGGDRIVVNKSPFVNKTVTILGQVKKPGAIALPLDGRLDLMTAIAMAGGFTELANLKKVTVTRGGLSKTYDVEKLGGTGRGGIPLVPNDIVTVAERWF